MIRDCSSYQSEWLEPICYPLANKFIQRHNFKGRVRGNDDCLVVKTQTKEIIALVLLRPIASYQLLTGMCVAPAYQREGIGTQLLTDLREKLTVNTYTFNLKHLTLFYQKHGFKLVSPDNLPAEIFSRYQAYLNQGRDIDVMKYEAQSIC